jgi:hypothetical protein
MNEQIINGHDSEPEFVDVTETGVEYPSNPLSAFEAGAQLDLRVRMALQLLQSSPLFTLSPITRNDVTEPQPDEKMVKATVSAALMLASELIEQGKQLGLVQPLPQHDLLPVELQHHLSRQARAQVFVNGRGQVIAQQEQPVVQAVPAGLVSRGH